MQNSTAIRECDVDTVRIISIKGISKVGNSFLSDLGRPGKSYNYSHARSDGLRPSFSEVSHDLKNHLTTVV